MTVITPSNVFFLFRRRGFTIVVSPGTVERVESILFLLLLLLLLLFLLHIIFDKNVKKQFIFISESSKIKKYLNFEKQCKYKDLFTIIKQSEKYGK